MPGSVPGINRSPGGAKIRGVVHVYYSKHYGRWIARSWPKGNGGDTNKRRWSREAFSNAVQTLKLCSASDQQFAEETAKATPYFKRDILMKMVMGTLFKEIITPTKTYVSARLANMNIQQGLDSISTTPGAMVVRTSDGWVALVPGDENDVLTINPGTGLPDWAPAQGGGTSGSNQFATTNHPTNAPNLSTSNYATKGVIILPVSNISISAAVVDISANADDTYMATLCKLDGSYTVTSILAQKTITFEATARGIYIFDFGASYAIAPGSMYALCITITSGTGTTPALVPSTTAQQWAAQGCKLRSSSDTVIRSAQATVNVGDTLATITGSQIIIDFLGSATS